MWRLTHKHVYVTAALVHAFSEYCTLYLLLYIVKHWLHVCVHTTTIGQVKLQHKRMLEQGKLEPEPLTTQK